MQNDNRQSPDHELLPSLNLTLEVDGLQVIGRCYRVAGRVPRHEIILEAVGQRAIVDVGDASTHELAHQVSVAAKSFALGLLAQRVGLGSLI